MKTNYIKYLFIGLLSIFMLSSCAKKRKKGGEVTKTRMFFHNLTSKYNGYFNADELMFFTEEELSGMHTDNYNQILDVYDYVDVDNPKAVASNLDKAIEKVGTVASLHRPSHWLDDCYVLMAKAQYMKHDYESAQETLEYFQEEFDPKNPFGSNFHSKKKSKKERQKEKRLEKKERKKEADKKKKEKLKERKKKKKNRKKGGKRLTKKDRKALADKEKLEKEQAIKLKELADKKEEDEQKEKEKEKAKKPKFYEHKPVYNEGLLWLAKTYIAREKWSTARSILKKIEQSDFYKPENLEKEIAITRADLHIKQKNYENAVPFLTAAVELSDKKKDKARYAYILAQIYDKMERYSDARTYYTKVSKLHPSYEMEFNADLNRYKTDLLSGSKSREKVVSILERMIKEEKNYDYRDQLYFTLGKLEQQQPDIPAAINYFKQSIQASTVNDNQKAESYYILADLYFDDEDYYNASMYYDSTANVMMKSDERFKAVKKLAKNLKEIGQNISKVRLQDSLLTIGELPKSELRDYALKIIEKENELKKKLSEGATNEKSKGIKHVVSSSKFGSQPSTFFAYHHQQVIAGIATFQDKWGDRELGDNWRRSSKFEIGDNSSDEEDDDDSNSGDVSDAEIQRALKKIPLTIGDKNKAKAKIEQALYKLGVLYRERLNNCNKSTQSLQRLLNDYPTTEYRVEACYILYVCNRNTDGILANKYADIIKSAYPDSKYAKFLTDPNYLKEYLSIEAKVGRYYDKTYALFSNGNYQEARNMIAESEDLFGAKNKYKAKFALLDAMAQGNTDNKEAYVKALKIVVSKYPNTPEKIRAQEILRFLKGDKYAFSEGMSVEGIDKFVLQDNRMHYAIVKVREGAEKVSADDMKISISDFNKKYYKLDKLKTKDSYLDIQTRTSIILIRKFSNKSKAMGYYDTVQKNKKDFLEDHIDFEIFVVTQRNYREILKQKTTDIYKQYFKENYLPKE